MVSGYAGVCERTGGSVHFVFKQQQQQLKASQGKPKELDGGKKPHRVDISGNSVAIDC